MSAWLKWYRLFKLFCLLFLVSYTIVITCIITWHYLAGLWFTGCSFLCIAGAGFSYGMCMIEEPKSKPKETPRC